MRTVALVDLGMGNLRSVERALARAAEDAGVACAVLRTSDPDAVRRADQIVVPGQGAFRGCSAGLAIGLAGGLGDAVRERIAAGAPYLGICLGLQALFDESDEAPGAPGLGVFPGRVVALTPGRDHKIPHTGWNQIEILDASPGGPLSAFAGEAPYFYFVHSFHAVPADPAIIAAVTQHGPHRITAAVHRENVTATQFHPEKSQAAGLRFLAAFLGR
jgi:imidazole glycerol-phosphate synthase subunit HisH